MDNEIWKDIKLDKDRYYYEKYEASNLGRIRNKFTGKVLVPFKGKRHNKHNQYWLRVFLYYDINHYYKVAVHRIIALTFLDNPNPDSLVQVNHIDGNPENNILSNLEWCTASENMLHAYSHNLVTVPHGSYRPNAVWDEDIVRYVCYFMERGMKAKEITDNLYEYGICYSGIATRSSVNCLMKRIRSRRAWKQISSNYNIE